MSRPKNFTEMLSNVKELACVTVTVDGVDEDHDVDIRPSLDALTYVELSSLPEFEMEEIVWRKVESDFPLWLMEVEILDPERFSIELTVGFYEDDWADYISARKVIYDKGLEQQFFATCRDAEGKHNALPTA